MKKVFFLSVVCFSLATIGNAQTSEATLKSEIKTDKKMGDKVDERVAKKKLRKLEGNEVSYAATQAFEDMYPHIKPVSTERLDNFDEFEFIKDGHKIAAFFDGNAKLVATTQVKTYADLPAKSRKFIEKKYPGYHPSNILFLDNNENNDTNMILYNSPFDPVDSYFVELSNGFKAIVLQVELDGTVYYFGRAF